MVFVQPCPNALPQDSPLCFLLLPHTEFHTEFVVITVLLLLSWRPQAPTLDSGSSLEAILDCGLGCPLLAQSSHLASRYHWHTTQKFVIEHSDCYGQEWPDTHPNWPPHPTGHAEALRSYKVKIASCNPIQLSSHFFWSGFINLQYSGFP